MPFQICSRILNGERLPQQSLFSYAAGGPRNRITRGESGPYCGFAAESYNLLANISSQEAYARTGLG
jgi:hypothetical protein